MMQEIPERDRAGLREFGLTTGAIIGILFGLILPWIFDLGYPLWPWIVGGVLVTWALVAPGTLGPVYRLWMRLALLLNRITTPIIMGALFFLLFTPVGLLMRIFRKDAMARRFDEGASSYRIVSNKAPKEKMERPF